MPFVKVRTDRCKGCGLCIPVCPVHLLGLMEVLNELGVQPVGVVGDPSECTGCLNCATMCPEAAIEIHEDVSEKA